MKSALFDRFDDLRRLGLIGLVCLLCWVGVAHGARAADLQGDVRVHDPSMIKQGKTYYVFSTGAPNGSINDGNIQIRASDDLVNWRFLGTVFQQTPAWITDTLGVKPRSLWAPDISFFDGKYHLYYAASTFGSNNSLIALATNRTLDPTRPDYKWLDEGVVLRSTRSDDWNAIDPQLSFDAHGTPWLAFGSFWSGIKLRRLDVHTGKLSAADATLYAVAARPMPDGGGPIEAPAIIRHGAYYYLFVSFDFCCRGVKSTYKIAVGRARNITGPYFDRQDKRMDQGGGTILLTGDERHIAAGGQSVYLDGNACRLVYHYYDALDGGKSKLQISELKWTKDGWPTVTQTPGK
ncbi:MAG: arabinan endo-1,5-alpha-L-arabinosidase [Pyrinomonadaceae bacterium]